MPRGRPRTFELTLTPTERAELAHWAHARSLPHALVQRAKAMLLSAEGLANTEVAARVDLSHVIGRPLAPPLSAGPTAGLVRRAAEWASAHPR